jgi:hypothetical protein
VRPVRRGGVEHGVLGDAELEERHQERDQDSRDTAEYRWRARLCGGSSSLVGALLRESRRRRAGGSRSWPGPSPPARRSGR